MAWRVPSAFNAMIQSQSALALFFLLVLVLLVKLCESACSEETQLEEVPITDNRLNSSRLRPKKPFDSRFGVTLIVIA